jgi:hypothetical protein
VLQWWWSAVTGIGYREFLTEQRENLGATWPLYAAAGSAHPIRVDSHEAVVALVFEDDQCVSG